MTPELIGILAVGATVVGLLLTFQRDTRADIQALRAEFRTDNQRLRAELGTDMESFQAEVRANRESFRAEIRADMESFRNELRDDMDSFRAQAHADNQSLRTEVRTDFAQVRGDLADLRKDVQALTERTSRVEGVIEGGLYRILARARTGQAEAESLSFWFVGDAVR